MDPLTITTTVVKVSSTCLSTAKTLYEVRAQYKDAPMYIVSITSEISVISASLSNVQSLLLRDPDLPNLLALRPELIAALDASLTGCMVLFSCLDDEMSRITASSQPGAISWRSKARMVWNRDKLRELLEALRGLQMSMNMLIQLLQVDSLAEIKRIVEEGRPALAATVQRTQSLRSSYPQIGVAESVYSQDDRVGGGEVEEYATSIWSDREFDFDDLIVSSKVYRRALAAARAGKQPSDGTTNEQNTDESNEQAVFGGDLIDFSDTATITQKVVDQPSIYGATRELAGLTLSDSDPAGSDPKVLAQSVNEQTRLAPGLTRIPHEVRTKHQQSYQKEEAEPDTALPRQEAEQVGFTSLQKRTQPIGTRVCSKCAEPVTGQFVRALGGEYHLECFKCADCGLFVANKFFPVPEEGPNQYPLCETDYFRRLDLLCFTCGCALRGSYITALERKYHVGHFTCSVCPHVFGAEESYYEHDGKLYCHYHYTTAYAQDCSGCQTGILKQFVEIFRTGQSEHWHPECYMIHKYWNVRLELYGLVTKRDYAPGSEVDDESRNLLQREAEEMEERVYRIWKVLSAFEEYSATLLSDVLLHVANGNALLAVPPMARLIENISGYIECLLAVDIVRMSKGFERLSITREFKLLCKKIVTMLSVMTVPKGGVTQELLSVTTGMAHYNKLLIRIGLQGALQSSALSTFLDLIPTKGQQEPLATGVKTERLAQLAQKSADECDCCGEKVEGACYLISDLLYHMNCISCPQCKKTDAYTSEDDREERERGSCRFCGCLRDENTTFLGKRRQYIHLLWVAFARFLVSSKIDWTVALKAESDMPEEPEEPTRNQASKPDGSTDSLHVHDIRRIVATQQSSH